MSPFRDSEFFNREAEQDYELAREEERDRRARHTPAPRAHPQRSFPIPDHSRAYQTQRLFCYHSLIPKHRYTLYLGQDDDGASVYQCSQCGHTVTISVHPFGDGDAS